MRKYFGGVDAVRYVAAVFVMLFHFCAYFWQVPRSSIFLIVGLTAKHPPLFSIFWVGWIGVEIFFVISGLVIANSAFGKTPLYFANSRIVRLYPVAMVCGAIALLVCAMRHVYVGKALLVRAFNSLTLNPWGPWLDTVIWTLGVEIAFYFLMFCWMVLKRHAQPEVVAIILSVWSALFALISLIYSTNLDARIERLLLLRHGCFFAVGIFIWSHSEGRLGRFGQSVGALAVASCVLEILRNAIDVRSGGFPLSPTPGGLALPVIIWLLAVVAIVIAVSHPTPQKWAHILRMTGLSTYPLYLVHQPIGGVAIYFALREGFSPLVAVLLGMSAALTVAFLISWKFEPPLRKLLQAFLEHIEVRCFRGKPKLAFLYRC